MELVKKVIYNSTAVAVIVAGVMISLVITLMANSFQSIARDILAEVELGSAGITRSFVGKCTGEISKIYNTDMSKIDFICKNSSGGPEGKESCRAKKDLLSQRDLEYEFMMDAKYECIYLMKKHRE